MNNKFKIIEEQGYLYTEDKKWHLPLHNNPILPNLGLLPEIVVEDEEKFIEKGKEHWNLEILKKVESGYVKSSTLKYLIDKVIENTWEQCKRYFNEIIVKDDVEKLAEEYVIDESYLPIYKEECKRAYINGYKAATKKYSEEDLRKAIKFFEVYITNTGRSIFDKDISFYLDTLKQPKTPKWFVAEVGYTHCDRCPNGFEEYLETTTINNKTYLVGKFIYE
jgi:hypothetical protein